MNGLRVEVLVYVYLAVCLAMILFNIATILFTRQRDRINEKHRAGFRRMISAQLERIRAGESVEKRHGRYMKRKLRHPESLLVFIQVMRELFDTFPEEVRSYLNELSALLHALMLHYERQRDPILFAFFLYSLKEFGSMSGVTPPDVRAILLRALRMNNTYCRENALQAIYGSGLRDLVVQALEVLDDEQIPHNKKLLTDGLLTFRGSKEELQELLWEKLEDFSVNMQQVILDFIRFCPPGKQDRIYSILTDETRSPELRFSCMRYFAKYPDEKAYPVLLKMAGDFENRRWEFPAIACTALASYPGPETTEALKRALHVSSWYVRYNAAESLAKLGVSYMDLIEVIDGNDRYAREILQFQLDMQYNQRKEAAAR